MTDKERLLGTKIHEAGHAVGALLHAKIEGWEPHEMLESVEISDPVKRHITQFGGVTVTKMVTKEMQEYLLKKLHYNPSVRQMRERFDLDALALRKIIVGLLGGAAQAKHFGCNFLQGIRNPFSAIHQTSRGDWAGIMSLAEMNTSSLETAERIIEKALVAADELVQRADVWDAINAVGRSLKIGDNSVPEIIRLTQNYLQPELF